MIREFARVSLLVLLFSIFSLHAYAQQTLGAVNGTVTDNSGAIVQGATVKVHNIGTNLEQTSTSRNDGSFSVIDLPIGTYEITISKTGFKTEVYSQIFVRGNLTATVNATLQPGEITSTVTVTATPLMNQTDTSNGYTLGSELVENIPLGTGSFTQLAILAPGVSADLLSGSGTNEGFGNQAIFANGQRDTSNSFTFNSVDANNLFNGKSTSYVSASRFTLNTGESFGVGGQVNTNTSVYDAIGQGLPTPPLETIEELHVTTSMYDASQGAHSGAHIELTTKSGTNQYHGQAYEYFETNSWDATPVFLKALGPPLGSATPALKRNVFGGNIGGPIIKNKLFFFGAYQGQRVHDALNGSIEDVFTLQGLTDTNRDAADIATLTNNVYGTTLTAADVDPAALAMFTLKTPQGQFVIPSQNATLTNQGNAVLQGPPATFTADQVVADIDYNVNNSDRIAGKYYFQRNPSVSPFAISESPGFPQSLEAGSQVFSLNNTTVLTPNTTWVQRIGFSRELANATTAQALTGNSVSGLVLPNENFFPGFTIFNADGSGNSDHELKIGPSTNFANAGVFQNQFEIGTNYSWVHRRHTVSFGFNGSYSQLNVVNREDDIALFEFDNFPGFVTGTLGAHHNTGTVLNGETNRYFRAKQAGLYAQDDFKLKSNLTIDVGVRWDWDGPLYEENGLFTNFEPSLYDFDLATDQITNIGLVVAGNNPTLGTKGVSASTLTGRQWLFQPRIGVAWSPGFVKNVVVRAGFGMYADRGEYFTEFSNSAGLGISGPFGVTTQPPFTIPVSASCASSTMCLSSAPFGTGPLPPPPNTLNGIIAQVPNLSAISACPDPVTSSCVPTLPSETRPFLFAGYDPRNKLPYSENWSLDLQWQPTNTLVLTLGYFGNHGVHQVIPIPFNTPGIATASHPINNQTVSYGMQPLDSFGDPLVSEQVQTQIGNYSYSDGNTALRVPFVGYNPNSNFWEAEGISHYNALEVGVNKRLSKGLQITGSYTWSHSLDEQSGLGLFYNGNNPLDPASGYASSDFDRTHVFNIGYLYQFPKIANASRFVDLMANGWGFSGITVAESGQPFLMYDYSGSIGNIFYSGDDFITNPIIPLAPGITPKQAQQSTIGYNAKQPYVNPNDFTIPLLQPGQDGVPNCGPTVPTNGPSTIFCDTVESGFGNTGRNTFRAPFQVRFDFSLSKTFKLTERFTLKYEADFFNIFNHPSFDAPNNNITLDPCFNPQPCYTNPPSANQDAGLIQDTLGSPRFIQMALHLTF
jgi:hypothetical protein